MKVFLSSLENGAAVKDGTTLAQYFVNEGVYMKYNLMSYYYLRGRYDLAKMIKDHSEEVMIDSGAHSFHQGKKVDWLEYTKEYAKFIQAYDCPKVVGFFEMDIDPAGYPYSYVLELREILENVSDKIIPVWHKNRGLDEFKKMCRDYSGKVVAITGFRNEDIKDEQYMMFLKYAKKHDCIVHCLGMTRKRILDKVPFDYVDSSSWKQQGIFGRIDGHGKVTREFSKNKREVVFKENYIQATKMAIKYYEKWKNVCKYVDTKGE